ncbi:MAG: polymerase primary sigma factor [Thermoleophilaceae bacterium]|nr:polymerase primary sigma factor [Thermoleophilaceae bacterium]
MTLPRSPAPIGHVRRTPGRERALVAEAASGDARARRAFVEAFLPLISSVASHYVRPGTIDRAELTQEGVVGLLRALKRFDQSRGTPFWAYASWWVRQAMQQLVAEMVRPIVLSDRAVRQLSRIKRARAAYQRDNSHEATSKELAATTGIEARQLQSLLAAERSPLPLDEPAPGSSRGSGTLSDLVADPRAADDFEGVLHWVEVEELPGLEATLTKRERGIINARYGVGCRQQTLREVADTVDLSAERVRQIEREALGKLRVAAHA